MATNNRDDVGRIEDLEKSFEKLGKPIDQILDAIGSMYSEANKLNNAFLQSRTRLDEMNDAVAKAAAGVIRLGGNINDVGDTMIGIADGARRNVIATEDQVSKLYAATTILGGSTKDLVENFDNVGISVSQIGTNLESSIEYIQSVGLNAKTVMGDVTNNMEQMNRFQFDNGVQGLAKMAAQSSMLKFDMKQTFAFADRVLDPEGAINMAAAFQRLGVSVGNLTDPFALMNESINDPTGLQNSLARVGEKYTVFDEKTKTFKINPQGVLILREMEKEAQLVSGTLSKSALAAADLDRRVSNINPSLKFDSEEDKQFLANMATMNKEGEYTVQLKNDKTGEVETKRLGDITQEEMEKLREQQERAPKTLEEIQINQLDVLKNIESAISGNVAKATYGIAGASVIRGNILGADRITRAVTGAVDKNVPESTEITKSINTAVGKMSELFTKKDTGKISDADFAIKIAKLEDEIKNKASEYGSKGIDALKNILEETNKNITGSSGLEKEFKKYTTEMLTGKKELTPTNTKTGVISGTQTKPLTREQILGIGGTTKKYDKTFSQQKQVNSQVDFGGTITVKVDAPPGVALNQKQLNDVFNSQEFKQYIVKVSKSNTEGKNQGVVSYG
jgi:hypothetical protein